MFRNNKSSTISLGIPVRNDLALALATAKRATQIKEVDEILISVNCFTGKISELNQLQIDPRITVFSHVEDLGLYGNFRFLLESASTKYFFWNCVDDFIGPNFLSGLNKENFDHDRVKLYLPFFVTSEFSPTHSTWDSTCTEYPLAVFQTKKERRKLARHVEPSWIFGLWDRDYLISIFPRKPFDWLDVHILQKSLLENVCAALENKEPILIGTALKRGKTAGSPVSNVGHSSVRYIFRSFSLTKYFISSPKLLVFFFLTVFKKIVEAKRLNRGMLHGK